MNIKIANALLSCVALGFTALSGAQVSAQTLLPTNLPGVYALAGPPAGTDPIHASSVALQAWGFPPRPDPVRAPNAYALWARMVSIPATRVVPVLVQTDHVHGPALPVRASAKTRSKPQALDLFNSVYTYNWSGIADTVSTTSFGSTSFYLLYGQWNVPRAQQAFGVCSGGWDYSSTWMGVDGYGGSADVFQAGTSSDAYCSGGTTTPAYYTWYEWYPAAAVAIASPVINPGDDMVMSAYLARNTSGTFYITDATTNVAVYITFSPPAGTQLIGNSAEWVVERPNVGGSAATLTNYVEQFFANAVVVQKNGTALYGAQGSSSVVVTPITMLDNSGAPISYLQSFGLAAFNLLDEGSAQ